MIAAIRQVRPIGGRNHQATLALGFLTKAHGTGNLSQDGGLLRLACFEQVGNTGQTTGDVTGLGTFLRDTGDYITDTDFRTIFHGHDSVGRQEVVGRHIGACNTQLLALLVHQAHRWANILAGRRTLCWVDHGDTGQACQIVGLALDGDVLFHAGELHRSRHFRDDRVSVRIPGGNHIAGGHFSVVGNGNGGTVGQLVALALTTADVGYRQLSGAGYGNQVAITALDKFQVVQTHSTFGFHLDAISRSSPRCRTTNVEGTHGQLGTRLTNTLGRNNTNGLAHIDAMATGQVTAITHGTNAVAGFTGNRRTNLDLVDTHFLQAFHPALIQHGAGSHGNFVIGARTDQIANHDSTQYPVTQGLDDVTPLDNRRHQQALLCTAVVFGHHQVLGHVDQATGQVTGVSGFQCSVGETLTGTVGRDEVLQYVQTLAEVCRDRGFDDRAIRLGHQAAHARQLANLCR